MRNEFFVDYLRVLVCGTREELGAVAAEETADYLKSFLASHRECNVIFAAAPSQNEFLDHLSRIQGIDWPKIQAFHMDEYMGLADDAPQRFSRYLDEHIFSKVPFQKVNYLNPQNKLLLAAYDALFQHGHADACFMGIGENGHIAFNDPDVANLFDTYCFKQVSLDNACRMQQVHDGCFAAIEEVPKRAVSLTVPTLLRSSRLFCMVPGHTKARAVREMLCGPIGMSCPASSLRLHTNATLYLDRDSAQCLELS